MESSNIVNHPCVFTNNQLFTIPQIEMNQKLRLSIHFWTRSLWKKTEHIQLVNFSSHSLQGCLLFILPRDWAETHSTCFEPDVGKSVSASVQNHLWIKPGSGFRLSLLESEPQRTGLRGKTVRKASTRSWWIRIWLIVYCSKIMWLNT